MRRPTPGGPPSLCADSDTRSASTCRSETSTLPAAWTASVWKRTPAARQARATSATGCSTPVSLLAHMRLHRPTSGPSAAKREAAVTSPSGPGGTSVSWAPWACS